MSVPAWELKRWAGTLDPDDDVAIDEGWLTLIVNGKNPDAYLEIGGMSEEDEEE